MFTRLSRALARFNDRPYVLIAISTFMWGANVIAGRLAVGEISPMSITCGRWLIVCGIFAVTLRRRIVAEWPLVAPHWRKIAILGATGFTLFNAIFYISAVFTTGVNMAVIQGTYPAFVLVGMALVFGARVTLMQGLGIGLTFVGVAAVASHGDLSTLWTLTFNRGDLLLLVGTLIFAIYTIALRDRPPASAIVLFAALAGAAFLTSIPFLAVEMALGLTYAPSLKGLVVTLFIALGPSLISQVFFIRAIELIGPSRTGVFYNIVPVIGALLAVAVLGEPFHAYHAVAFVLVMSGIWLAEWRAFQLARA